MLNQRHTAGIETTPDATLYHARSIHSDRLLSMGPSGEGGRFISGACIGTARAVPPIVIAMNPRVKAQRRGGFTTSTICLLK